MLKMRTPILGTIAAAVIVPMAMAAEPLLTREQILLDQAFELGDIDYDNSVPIVLDIATGGPVGVSQESGEQNLQDNADVLTVAPTADAVLQQTLNGQDFSGESSSAVIRNETSVDISASDEVTNNIGVNAAAGAFNLQQNASVVAIVPGELLATSLGDARQGAELNASVFNDITNDVQATIITDRITGNVGLNSVSGVGNEQSNSTTMTIPTGLSF